MWKIPLKRAYAVILIVFIGFLALLNIVTFLAGFNKAQLANIYYIPERAMAVMMFFEHIVFESGVILRQPSEKELEEAILKACENSPIDPRLVRIMTTIGGGSIYEIFPDGSVGLMRVKPSMATDTAARNLFLADENIEAGVDYLKKMLEESEDLAQALTKYYAPSKSALSSEVKAMYELADSVYLEFSGS